MRGWFLLLALLASLLASSDAPAQPPPQPAIEKNDKAEPKAKAFERLERDGSSGIVYYTLAAIGVIVVMVLVCMPARRN